MTKGKIKKIMQFDKLIQRFCNQIGIEKKSLLTALMGDQATDGSTAIVSGELSSTGSLSRPGTTTAQVPDSIDTGKAAILAYTNLNAVGEEIIEWKKSPHTRNIHPTHSSGDGGNHKPSQKAIPHHQN